MKAVFYVWDDVLFIHIFYIYILHPEAELVYIQQELEECSYL